MSSRDPRDWARLKPALAAALELEEEDRDDCLRRRLGEWPDLLREARELLSRSESSSLAGSLVPGQVPRVLEMGSLVGPFAIEGVLGEGASSRVYAAIQAEPQRTVALKVLRAEHSGPEEVARFIRETRLLAQLQHPGIATLLDAGVERDEEGELWWLALEKVEGARTLTKAARDLVSLDARVALFLTVCDAVHHGHLRGVLHRDLKPSNVLVDDQGRPHVIDFGTGRALDGSFDAVAPSTRVGQFVGTLSYSSPEQLAGDPLAIDARTDIYSLGVMLYEVLTGSLPLALHGLPFAESARAVQEEAPARPPLLRAGVGRDLQHVVLHALEKAPRDRYPSVAAFADDLRRVLAHRAPTCRPAGVGHQLRLLLRRHRVASVAIGVGFVLSAVSLGLILEARDEAAETRAAAETERIQQSLRLTAEREEKQRRLLAQDEAYAEALGRFLQQITGFATPAARLGDPFLAAIQLLDFVALEATERLGASPQTRVEVHSLVGGSYERFALGEEALKHHQLAWEGILELGVEDELQGVLARFNLGSAHYALDQRQESRQWLEAGFDGASELGDARAIARFHMALSALEHRDGTIETALEHARAAVDGFEAITPADHSELAMAWSALQTILLERPGQEDEAREAAERAFAASKHLEEEQPFFHAERQLRLAEMLEPTDVERALSLYRTVSELARAGLPPGQPLRYRADLAVGNVLRRQGRPNEAVEAQQRAAYGAATELAPDSELRFRCVGAWAGLCRDLGRPGDAEAELRLGLEGTTGAMRGMTLHALADVAVAAGRMAEAAALAAEAVPLIPSGDVHDPQRNHLRAIAEHPAGSDSDSK